MSAQPSEVNDTSANPIQALLQVMPNTGTPTTGLLKQLGEASAKAFEMNQRDMRSGVRACQTGHRQLWDELQLRMSQTAGDLSLLVNQLAERLESNSMPSCNMLGAARESQTLLRPFTGFDDVSFSAWIRRFEDVANMQTPALTLDRKAMALIGFLDQLAREKVEEMPPADQTDFVKVKEHLEKFFESPQLRGLARRQLTSCKQGPSESVKVFAERLGRLTRAATNGIGGKAQSERIMDEFCDRLRPNLAFHVKAQNPATFEEAMLSAQTFEVLLATNLQNVVSRLNV